MNTSRGAVCKSYCPASRAITHFGYEHGMMLHLCELVGCAACICGSLRYGDKCGVPATHHLSTCQTRLCTAFQSSTSRQSTVTRQDCISRMLGRVLHIILARCTPHRVNCRRPQGENYKTPHNIH